MILILKIFLRVKPPDLPPRNTPRESLASPDYMDVEGEDEVESLETFQHNILPRHCLHCKEQLQEHSRIINTNGDLYHKECFVCAQCFQEFPGRDRHLQTSDFIKETALLKSWP